MVQRHGRHAQQADAASESRNETAAESLGSLSHFRRGAGRSGDEPDRPVDRYPRRSPRAVQKLPLHAAGQGLRTGKGARHPGAHLFQERERQSRRLAQAELGPRSSLLLQAARRHEHHDRDRRRPMGSRPVVRRQGVRAGTGRLHGQDQLRAETLPALDHADFPACRLWESPASRLSARR